MKIEFDDKGYVEIKKSNTPNKIWIVIQAIDPNDKNKKIVNAAEITSTELNKMLENL